MSKRAQVLICSIIALVLMINFGCERQAAGTKETPKASQSVEQLKEQNAQLQVRLEQEYKEKEQLKKQISLLQGLPAEKRVEAIYNLQSVQIGRYTNIYEKEEEPNSAGKKKLVVYVQPIDETGDSIKAAGTVDVQLWDLSKRGGEALIGQWRVEPAELKSKWLNSAFTSGYRLEFDVSTIVKSYKNELTVKITFTDYLSGRTFTEQKAIK